MRKFVNITKFLGKEGSRKKNTKIKWFPKPCKMRN